MLIFASCAVCAQSQPSEDGLAARLSHAMTSLGRPVADKAMDRDRKPAEVLAFIGIEPGMRVLDVSAAGGYYTELLAAAVGPTGTVYAQNDETDLTRNAGAIDKALDERLANGRLTNVKRIDADVYHLGLYEDVDAALVSLTLHDTFNSGGEDAARAMLYGVYLAMKPGAVLGLTDHVGEAGMANTSLHRIRKVDAERMLRQAGFTIEAQSSVLQNAEDDHSRVVSDPSIRWKTDRMVIRARKPK
jgi:predicted methyltransferase